jgi:hypothetical protein
VDVVGGDGVTKFELAVESQVKGARSAGKFKLALTVTDDAGGEATCVDWRYSREAAKSKASAKEAAEDAKMFAFVRDLATRGLSLSKRVLRDHDECPLSQKKATASLDRLIDAERLMRNGASIVLPSPRGAS